MSGLGAAAKTVAVPVCSLVRIEAEVSILYILVFLLFFELVCGSVSRVGLQQIQSLLILKKDLILNYKIIIREFHL